MELRTRAYYRAYNSQMDGIPFDGKIPKRHGDFLRVTLPRASTMTEFLRPRHIATVGTRENSANRIPQSFTVVRMSGSRERERERMRDCRKHPWTVPAHQRLRLQCWNPLAPWNNAHLHSDPAGEKTDRGFFSCPLTPLGMTNCHSRKHSSRET